MKSTLLIAFSLITLTGCAEGAGHLSPADRDHESAPVIAPPPRTTQSPGNTLPSSPNGGNTAGTAAR